MSRERTKGTPGPASAHDSVRSTLDTDGMLAEWGARLFYPIPKGKGDSGGGKLPLAAIAAAMTPTEVRSRIRSTVAPGATQVMVKITGGGRGMKAIAAHFRYIGRLGKDEAGGKGQTLEIEDERGEKIQGSAGLAQLTDEWRVAGAYIDDTSSRREAFNIIFSMPAGTPPEAVREATADAARELFEGHKYVFVLHEDQGAPHVHLSVRADRYDGVRLAPRKADLDRWRAVFARGLQDLGVNAVATRQPVRAANRNYRKLWEERAAGRGALNRQRPAQRTSARALAARAEAIMAWEQIARALASSKDPADVRMFASQWTQFGISRKWRQAGSKQHGWRRSVPSRRRPNVRRARAVRRRHSEIAQDRRDAESRFAAFGVALRTPGSGFAIDLWLRDRHALLNPKTFANVFRSRPRWGGSEPTLADDVHVHCAERPSFSVGESG